MTLLGRSDTRTNTDTTGRGRIDWGTNQTSAPMTQRNVGDTERAVSVAAGSILALLGVSRRSIPGIVIAAVGGAMIHRGVTGHCYMYDAMKIDTTENDTPGHDNFDNGIKIEQAFLINKSPEELYAYWRNFENLPNIMTHLKSVQVIDDRRSHWVARAPKLLGGTVEWDAEITADEPNSRIAWRSVGSNTIDTEGEIRFSKGLGDRGTEVHVTMMYFPPAGKLGHFITSMLGENPKRLVREDLRNFKRIMEVGEILTIQGQPHGTCKGRGEELHESEWKPLHM